jgi:hypothetical protein
MKLSVGALFGAIWILFTKKIIGVTTSKNTQVT